MGRKSTRWKNLPRGMRARPRGEVIYYYLDTGERPRREIPLGTDYVLAVKKWAELTHKPAPPSSEGTFAYVLARYWEQVIPTKAARTQVDNEAEKVHLLLFFDNPPAPLDSIDPVHIRKYLDWRVKKAKLDAAERNVQRAKDGKPQIEIGPKHGQVRANREKALFSHIWNFARENGYTKAPNPCQGVKSFREDGRDTYVHDEVFARAMQHAVKPLQFALRLAHLTGQRPSDVLRMSETAIGGGVLNVRQGKTGARLRIVIEGELLAIIEEMLAYKARVTSHLKVRSLKLLVNESGEALTYAMLRNRFDDARDAAGIPKREFQFRDLRAKAATEADEADGTRAAQALLGHTTEGMTADYIRHKAGRKVRPIR